MFMILFIWRMLISFGLPEYSRILNKNYQSTPFTNTIIFQNDEKWQFPLKKYNFSHLLENY